MPFKGGERLGKGQSHCRSSSRSSVDDTGRRSAARGIKQIRVTSGRRTQPPMTARSRGHYRSAHKEPRWASNTCTMQGWMSTRRLRPRAAFHRFPSAANYQTCDHPNMTASAGPPPSAAPAAWSPSRGGTPQNSSPLNDSVTDNRTASARSGEADKEAVVRGSGCQPGGSSSLNPSTQAGVRSVMRLTGAMRADD